MIAQFWEWGVLREGGNRPVGLRGTEHAAMAALSKALVAGGRPARGQVAQVTLIRPVHKDAGYVREPPQHTAVYDGTVIQWR
ncbi:MAG: hypothetical protein ACRDNF_14595 [Streptosporangiaceae bacterium]